MLHINFSLFILVKVAISVVPPLYCYQVVPRRMPMNGGGEGGVDEFVLDMDKTAYG